ncbi:MAG: hypothetical protein WCG27_08795, partial [Pseudomonadota bacterium]
MYKVLLVSSYLICLGVFADELSNWSNLTQIIADKTFRGDSSFFWWAKEMTSLNEQYKKGQFNWEERQAAQLDNVYTFPGGLETFQNKLNIAFNTYLSDGANTGHFFSQIFGVAGSIPYKPIGVTASILSKTINGFDEYNIYQSSNFKKLLTPPAGGRKELDNVLAKFFTSMIEGNPSYKAKAEQGLTGWTGLT